MDYCEDRFHFCNCFTRALDCSSDTCENRGACIECIPGKNCRVRTCNNQQFANLSIDVENMTTEIRRQGDLGDGLVNLQARHAGELLLIYRGETINLAEAKRRNSLNEAKQFYICSVSKNNFIDASNSRCRAMKINSCCKPNCKIQVWEVDGVEIVGVFAIRYICEGEYLSFFYNFKLFGVSECRCLCGSTHCRGSFVSSRVANHFSSATYAANGGEILYGTSTTAQTRKLYVVLYDSYYYYYDVCIHIL
jgi:SET domain-containing protein